MPFNFSLSQLLVISVLILIVVVPVGLYASPIFKTDTTDVTGGSFQFEPEQSWTGIGTSGLGKIHSTDVVVFDGGSLQEIYIPFIESKSSSVAYLAYTDNLQLSSVNSPYYIKFSNITQVIEMSEFIPPTTVCNIPSNPKVAVTTSHVFMSWVDQADPDCSGGNDSTERTSIAMVAIAKSKFTNIGTGGEAFFNHVSTKPAYFNTGTNAAAQTPSSYSITADGTNAYITWENKTDTTVNFVPFDGAAYIAATGDFGTNIILGSSTSKNPDVIVDDSSNIHVAWHNEGAGDLNVQLATSTNSGVDFTTQSITSTNTVSSTSVQLAKSGTIVYVSWTEGVDPNQLFVASSASNPSYTPVAVSTNQGTSTGQQIYAAGTKVYIVWQDTIDAATSDSHDILFSKSTDSGSSFLTTSINLSQNSGNSIFPKISGNATHVNVVWRDNTFAPRNAVTEIDGEVWFKSSSDSGASFGGLQVISEGTTDKTITDTNTIEVAPVPIPNISSSDEIIVAVWNPDPDDDIVKSLSDAAASLKTAVPSIIDISFNSTEYLSPRIATITVVDSGQNNAGSVSIDVLGDSMTVKSSPTLTEGPIGTFTGEIELYDATYKGELGDVFLANYTDGSGSTITTEAMITETRILDFVPTGVVLHDVGGKVGIRLTDADSNKLSGTTETLTVKIKSDVDNKGFKLTLTETGDNTGVFEALDSLVFMDGEFNPTVNADAITITQTDSSSVDDGTVQTITRNISTTTDSVGLVITLTETGLTTNVYTTQISICDESALTIITICNSPNIAGVGGDFIKFSSLGGSFVTHGIILPDDNASRGAIEVSCNGSLNCGQVRAIYNDLEVSFNVGVTAAGGGGGGGISRAGLVVNALAGISSITAGGSGTDGSPPISSLGNLISNKNFDVPDEIVKIVENYDSTIPLDPIPTDKYENFDLPLTINNDGYPLAGYSNTIQTYSANTGEPISITSLYYEQTVIQHVSMYLNLRDNAQGDLSKSDTQIIYNKNKELKIIDPNGFFEKVTVNIIEEEGTVKKFAQFDIVFAKSMDTTDIVLRSWDDKLRSLDVVILNALQIINPNESTGVIKIEPSETLEELTSEITSEQKQVPVWVKNNAKWWSDGNLDDVTFTNGIAYMIQEDIIHIENLPVKSEIPDETSTKIIVDSPSGLVEGVTTGVIIQPIPDWIKQSAGWWSEGLVTEIEFVNSMAYLVENEIILLD